MILGDTNDDTVSVLSHMMKFSQIAVDNIKSISDRGKLMQSLDESLNYFNSTITEIKKLDKDYVKTFKKIGNHLINQDIFHIDNDSQKSSFLELKDPDADPPKIYESDVLCKNPGDCFIKKLKWNKLY